DKTTPIITGGHKSGPGLGKQYAQEALNELGKKYPGILPDGIACHSYGRAGLREGEKQIDKHTKERYGQFGLIDDDVVAYSALLPGKPVWITEWGVLGQSRADQGENVAPPSEVAEYAENFIKRLQTRFAGQVAAAMWYAWAHYMDDGYGLVDRSGNDNGDFRQRYLKL
ncbi:MAG: hypothetical protein K8I60_11280, partial [Anaerolineae bacterium]|nr:hypothetical protein [Anaerolineae bacterium]